MTVRSVVDCDLCGQKDIDCDPKRSKYWVCIDRRPDAAGGNPDVWDDVDLCPKCASVALRRFLESLEQAASRSWIHWASGGKK